MTAMGIARAVRARPLLAYALGAACALMGWAVRIALFPDLTGMPFTTLLPMVIVAAWLAGLGPALACTAIAAVIGGSLWVVRDPANSIGLFLAVAITLSISIAHAVRASTRLREIEAEQRHVLEQQIGSRTAERDRLWSLSQDAFVVQDRDGAWLTASPAWERILGWPLSERIGHTSADILHPDDRAAATRELEHLMSGGVTVRFEARYRTSGGPYRWLSWNAIAEGDRVYCVVRDVSDIHDAARQLEQTQEALVQSQKIEAMGKVTGGVAHDFNNLLTPILGGLDLLQRRGLPDDRSGRLVAGALQAAERARTLVQRLLAFARRQPLQIAPVDLARLIHELRALIESTIGPRIGLVVALPPELPYVEADAAQLEMAMLNLAVNARDAMPDGGEISISAAPVRLTGASDTLAAGAYVRLTFADTGIGMSAEISERAIEPFFSTKGIGRGTGLGLSMVHGLMGQLGGALRIESTTGEGTRIHLWLPAADARPDRTEDIDAGGAARRESGTVLLVDDEELVRASVAAMLGDLGFQVTEAESAAGALALMDDGARYELIVTDHLMPGMTGTELAAEVRRRAPDQRLVIISGYSDLDEIAPDLPRLAKPFKQHELAAVVGR